MNKATLLQKKQFAFEYERLCILQNTCPLPSITANLKNEVIDFNADRLRLNEWEPLLGAICVNDSLKYVAVRSYWQPDTNVSRKKTAVQKKKSPVIRSRDATLKLLKVLKDCLSKSRSLECLILQNIPLREQDMLYLAKGIERSKSLKHLSLQYSRIGDHLFEILSVPIKKSTTLLSIDFTGCGLSWKCAEIIASIIKFQGTQRHEEAWQESLRYRRPDLDRMHGLRRVTISDNKVGDSGARILADAIKDDLWLKALDLQQCGISNEGAMIIKEALEFNKTLYVIDLRRNSQIDNDLLRAIIEHVMISAGGENPEYTWISAKEASKDRRASKFSYSKMHSSKRTQQNRSGKIGKFRDNTSVSNYYPWRSEERISKRRRSSNLSTQKENYLPSTAVQAFHNETYTRNHLHSTVKANKKYLDIRHFEDEYLEREEKKPSNSISEEHLAELLEQLNFYKDKYEKEKQLKNISEQKVELLTMENENLKKELEILKKPVKTKTVTHGEERRQQQSTTDILPLEKGILEDDKVLESIEASFIEFQQFLDMLKSLGLGDLYKQMQLQQDKYQGNQD